MTKDSNAIAAEIKDLTFEAALKQLEETAKRDKRLQKDAALYAALLRAIGQQPTHAAANYNLALLYEQSGDRGQAFDHYTAFLKTAGPEHGALLTDVRRRVDALRGTAP